MNLVPGFKGSVTSNRRGIEFHENPYAMATQQEIKDQFMVGDDLLVAPLVHWSSNPGSGAAAGKMVRLLHRQICGEEK
jgi:alpha-D-xyloside xylohydrolase